MAGRDRISGLPADILDIILGFLPIEEAARTVVLSTIWRDIWSSLTQLNFDGHFFSYIWKKYSDSYNCTSTGLYIINKVLMQHNGSIRKFAFKFFRVGKRTTRSRSFDFDQWLLFLTRNGVEEIHLDVLENAYKLPNCIFSCKTLKKLYLDGVIFEPINAPCILPNVTSLCFKCVQFKPRNLLDCVFNLPMLENLSFEDIDNMFYFNIIAPRLDSLTIKSCFPNDSAGSFLPVNLDLRSISTLDLDLMSFEGFVEEFTRKGQQRSSLNVEHLKLSISNSLLDNLYGSAFIQLLRICPKVCLLDISTSKFAPGASMSKFFKELRSVAQTQEMLHTLKLSSFIGSKFEMVFVKGLLSCFPALEKVVVIFQEKLDSGKEFKIVQKLLRFPCASAKAKIVYNYES